MYNYSEETIQIWLEKLNSEHVDIDKEIEETKGSISNERLWQNGAETSEQVQMHEENIANLVEYLSRLEELKADGSNKLPKFEKSADSLKNLPIISIDEFNNNVAPRISSKIDTSKIRTVKDIYRQRSSFAGAMMTVSPNLSMLPNLIERVSFTAWWIVEDENKHHCIVY